MTPLPGDELVAEYLARAAGAAAQRLPAHARSEFLERLHTRLVAVVGPAPRADAAAVLNGLAVLGDPFALVGAELYRSSEAMSRPVVPTPPDALTAAVARAAASDLGSADRSPVAVSTAEEGATVPGRYRRVHRRGRNTLGAVLPAKAMVWLDRLVEEDVPRLWHGLVRVRWELGTVAVFLFGPSALGLLACLIGAGCVARSAFWEIKDKVRAVFGIPAVWLFLVVLRAWGQATLLARAPTAAGRLSVAGHSVTSSLAAGPGVLGLLIAIYLGVVVVREARWS
jgi:hypothetical protein